MLLGEHGSPKPPRVLRTVRALQSPNLERYRSNFAPQGGKVEPCRGVRPSGRGGRAPFLGALRGALAPRVRYMRLTRRVNRIVRPYTRFYRNVPAGPALMLGNILLQMLITYPIFL